MATKLFIILLLSSLLTFFANRSFAALTLTYDGCMANTGLYSYQVGGWCFMFYFDNTDWTINNAESACGSGTLAVGVTYKMIQKFETGVVPGWGWMAGRRNASFPLAPQSNYIQGWYWMPKLADGSRSIFPVIMSNIPWFTGEPSNAAGSEDAFLVKEAGLATVYSQGGVLDHNNNAPGVICQFVPISWNFLPKGTGRFANATLLVSQTTCIQPACILKCHWSVFCISLAYNPTTSDCQIYAVSPEDPRFSSMAIADPLYNWYIRDGMEY